MLAHFFFALFAGIDQADIGADRLSKSKDLLVGQRLCGHDHLAALQQEANDVGTGAVQLWTDLLRASVALDHDRARRNRRTLRGVRRDVYRTQFLE